MTTSLKKDHRIYIITDGEFDGPIPGVNSMLSFASVAVSAQGEWLGEFEAVLEPLPNGVQSPETMAFWRTCPEAYAAATQNPIAANKIMKDFVSWIKSFQRNCIFASHPLALDGLWFDYYLRRFADMPLYEGPWKKDRLFNGSPLCLASFAAGRLQQSAQEDCHYPDAWLGNQPHTHKAIDDARGYAHLFLHLTNLA